MDKIEREIRQRLRTIEETESAVILFAVESGSRAWGFESADSDYDVRFVYKHEADWYVSIDKKRDVIERPPDGVFDFSGWDIRKTLNLFAKSNPPLLEWLKSPITYLEQGEFRKELRRLETTYFSDKACILHYLHMARGNYRDYLKQETARTKKYFYVLRPLLACEWIRRFREPPPIEFEKLADAILPETEVRNQVFDLLSRKRAHGELGEGPSIPGVNGYIEQTIAFYENYALSVQKNVIDAELLNDLFRKTICHCAIRGLCAACNAPGADEDAP